jgi:F-type H+-transporting ATPase subunit gamma
MASLKELRTRIASVKATQKITKAMQMVAAAKLRRAQLAAEAARPYAERMDKAVTNLTGGNSGGSSGGESHILLTGNGNNQVHLLIVCTSERGLCGAFNSSIVRLAKERISQLLAAGKTVKIFCVGKKGLDQLKRQYDKLIAEQMEFRAVKQISFPEADQVGRKVREMFDAGDFDVATLFYSRFKSVISQIPTAQQIIPLEVSAHAAASEVSYDYEPEQAELLADVLPRNISVQVFRAMLENAASEQGSRMSAMDNATRNAGEMIKKQTQIYNRTRQAMITKELIEIISGAEAL